MPTPSTLAMDGRENYKMGFVDGIIASSAAYITLTLIFLFIWSYQ
jgi:hypothetical protein